MNLTIGRLMLLALISGLLSCNIINPVEPVPAYINISSIKFTETPGKNVGSLAHKITDAWIYINNSPLGVHEIPFTIPVLQEGQQHIRIRAGIMLNGIAATRLVYPFYADFDTVINFVPGQTISLNPEFSYMPDTKFSLLEDFEGSGLKIEKSNSSDTLLVHVKNNPVVFEGNGCGMGTMDDVRSLFEVVSIENLLIPKNSPVYLELNYKSDVTFSAGFYANEPGQVIQYSSGLFINPSTQWNKIYVDMASAITSSNNASSFKLYIGALKNIDGTTKSLYFDNIKVVHW